MDTTDEVIETEWLSPQDVERMLHCSVSTARALINASDAPIFRSSGGKPGGIMRVRKPEFLAWLERQADRASAS